MSVTFVPVTESHRALLELWLAQPHAQAWWGDTQDELGQIYDGKGEHEPFIACINNVPIAYVQVWWPSTHKELPWQHGMALTERGIDITIGDAENLGRGYGPLIVKHFAAKLFAEGATRLITDPDSRNERAINAYLKAGFTLYDEFGESDGSTSLLMELLPEDFDYGVGYAQ